MIQAVGRTTRAIPARVAVLKERSQTTRSSSMAKTI
jgi:hypothetical protein